MTSATHSRPEPSTLGLGSPERVAKILAIVAHEWLVDRR